MLENWLLPIDTENLKLDQKTPEAFQFGQKIIQYTGGEAFPNLKGVRIAIIGLGAEDADAVRRALYPLMFPFDRLAIADLGNVRKQEVSFVVPLIRELVESGICPIIIGFSETYTLAQFQAYQDGKNHVNLNIVDHKIRFTPRIQSDNYFLHHILGNRSSHLFGCAAIGFQSHLTPPHAVDFFEKRNFDTFRLGKVRPNIDEMEPVIRDADLMAFSISAIRQSEAPAQLDPSPSGFFIEEACQIARFAGMSDKLTSVGFYGFLESLDQNHITANAVAQLIWYFIEGFYHRKGDYPMSELSPMHLTEYVVDVKELDLPVTFWKSNKSSRWWMQINTKAKRKTDRHKLVPCTYNDYLSACQGELSDRLLNAYYRFT
jgi:formiminoglutamase